MKYWNGYSWRETITESTHEFHPGTHRALFIDGCDDDGCLICPIQSTTDDQYASALEQAHA